jgi:NAD+ kinase
VEDNALLTIGLFPNIQKKDIVSVLDETIKCLTRYQVNIVLPEDVPYALNRPEWGKHVKADKLDIGITLGGDGTILSTARKIAALDIPLCGINLGRMGFLAEIELAEMEALLKKVVTGDFYIEERLMLAAFVERDGKTHYISSALNDIVIAKAGVSRMSRLKLYVGEDYTADYWADGLIVATATGSTGYSLSAGGPIVTPNLKAIIITPICPHSLNNRSLVVAEDEIIKLEISSTSDMALSADGQILYNLQPKDNVMIKPASNRAKFIRFADKSYYENLRSKIQRGERHANT